VRVVNEWRAGALFVPDPQHRILYNISQEIPLMLKKLLVALVASAFALGAYAQAPKSETKADGKGSTTAAEKKATKGEKKATATTKANEKKSEKAKAKSKSDVKSDAKKEKTDGAK
jgi:hypothetical protein